MRGVGNSRVGLYLAKGLRVMAEIFDVEDRWPELFVQLDEAQRRAVVQSLS